MNTTEMMVGSRPVSFAPRTLGEAMEFAKLVAESSFVPMDYRGRPGDILICLQMGAELGLSPMAALQSISVINGRPSVWGDGALALVRASGFLEDFEEKVEGTGDNRAGYCRMRRKGQVTTLEKRFTVNDAKRAGLWGKKGPWSTYPDRMLMLRARGFVLRDGFADVLRGIITREEAADMPSVEEQVRGAESDLPWAGRLSTKKKPQAEIEGTPDENLTAALQASLVTATDGGAASDSSDDPAESLAGFVAEEDETSLPAALDVVSEDEAAPPPPDQPPLGFEEETPFIDLKGQRRLHACRSEGKHSEDETKQWLFKFFGHTSTKQILKTELVGICNRLRDPSPLPV